MLMERFFSKEQLERLLFPKTDSSSRPIYFPRGKFGPAYIVATDDQKRDIVRGYVRTADAFFIAIIAGTLLVVASGFPPVLGGVLMAPLAIIFFFIGGQRNARGLEKIRARLGYGDALNTMSKAISWKMLIFSGVIVALAFLARLLWLVATPSWENAAAVLLFGGGAIAFGILIYLKKRQQQDAS